MDALRCTRRMDSGSRSFPYGRVRTAGVTEVRRVLAEFEPPPLDDAIAAELEEFVERRTAEGGALPE